MLLKLHPKIDELLHNPNHGTVIDGAFATQIYDTSGEIIDIAGMDISSLNEEGILNSEHLNADNKQFRDSPKTESGQWGTHVGRIVFAKKIMNGMDCESEREQILWDALQVPFIYGICELFDSEDHQNAKALASILNHYHNRGLPLVVRYSIEGATLDRQGQVLRQTIARRVAATVKPANKSSYNYMVSPATAEAKQIPTDIPNNEFSKNISVFEMTYNPYIADYVALAKSAVKELQTLNKTFTLGSYGVAPDQLTGGAAVAKADDTPEQKHKKLFIKSQLLAAVRDWDKVSSFKDFLKHRLPDADDKFIDRFVGIARDIKLIKNSAFGENFNYDDLIKTDALAEEYGAAKSLKPLEEKLPKGTVKFKNKHIVPGEIELVNGPFQGNKLKYLFSDNDHAYIQPPKAGDQDSVKINKLNRKLEGSHYVVNKPFEVLNLPSYVHGDRHADLQSTERHEQKELIHGLDLASETKTPEFFGVTALQQLGDNSLGWYKNSNGKMAYVKPAIDFKHDHSNKKISTAKREAVFYNMANNYFQLGEFVPTTAMFKHPDTKHEHSAMERMDFAVHASPGSNNHHHDSIIYHGDNGNLDKLAMMDVVMGNTDRNRLNYIMSPKSPNLHLIDNSLIFQYKDPNNTDGLKNIPDYIHDYRKLKGIVHNSDFIHPEAQKWIANLDPFTLGTELTRQGVDPESTKHAVQRLLAMKTSILLGDIKRDRVFTSPATMVGK